jgi:hypothetical protein
VTALTHDRRVRVDVAGLRWAGTLMLAAGVVWPLHPPALDVPCPFRAATGIPCPLCGMTRSVTSTVHGDVHEALVSNPAGILAVVVAVLLLVWRRPRSLTLPPWAVPAGIAALWSFQLLRLPSN